MAHFWVILWGLDLNRSGFWIILDKFGHFWSNFGSFQPGFGPFLAFSICIWKSEPDSRLFGEGLTGPESTRWFKKIFHNR